MRRRIWIGVLAVVLIALGFVGYRLATEPPVEDDTTPGVCELHHVPYADEVIPVEYGRPASPKLTEARERWLRETAAAWRDHFPHAHMSNGAGGCMIRPARFAKVSYCPECRKAEEAWYTEHGRMPPADKLD